MGKKIIAEKFIKEFDKTLEGKNKEQINRLLAKFTKKVIAKNNTNLSLKYAWYFKNYLSQQEIDALGQQFLDNKDIAGCVKFCMSFRTTNFKDYQKFVAESGNLIYILYFLKKVKDADLNYFSKKIANKISPIQNIDFVCEFDLENIMPHSRAIAKKGSALDNYEYLMMLYDYYNVDPTHIDLNIRKIVESKDVYLNFMIAKLFPSKYLSQQAQIIAQSNDMKMNFLAYDNWPEYEGQENDLALFEKVIKANSKNNFRAMLMFKLKMTDMEYINSIVEIFFPSEDEKS